MIGATLGHYKIEAKLGEGGMGVVYKATDTKLNRPVALKFLPSHVSEAEKDKERFVQEAQAAASLSHSNICTIHGIEEFEGKQFIVMEYVDGQTLQEKKQNLPLKQALEIGIQIADGLAAAHDKGIVHRDIKPENIMIKKDGSVQIMDFGLAKLRGATRLTKEGSTVGTVGYMSPEQVQGQEVDHRTDIFSLGVLLYEMIAGQSPFKGVHETAITYEIVNVDPPPIGSLNPEIDADLDAVVLDCVAKDPADRYQSAAEVGRNLRRVKRESSRSRVSRITGSRAAYVPPAAASGTVPSTLGAKRFAVLPWAVAGVFLITTLLFAWLSLSGSAEEAPELRFSLLPPAGISIGVRNGGHHAISPDGSMIVYTGVDSTGFGLYLRMLHDLMPRKLPGTEFGARPFWSPDNRWVGFVSRGVLKKIDVSGGAPLTICDAPAFRGGAWNQSGQIIFQGIRGGGLSIVNANGGDVTLITSTDTSNNENSHRWPSFLPDGDLFLYTVMTADNKGGIAIGSISSGDRKMLLSAASNGQYADGYLFYYRENKIMAQSLDLDALEVRGDPIAIVENVTYQRNYLKADFSVSRSGIITHTYTVQTASASIGWYNRDGSRPARNEIAGEIFDVRLSPDGAKLAVSEAEGSNSDIWIYDMHRNVRSRLTFHDANDFLPVWSADGRYVYFASGRADAPNIFRKNAEGTGTVESVLSSSSMIRPSSLSQDARYLYYTLRTQDGKDDIYALPLQGKKEPIAVVTSAFDNDWPAISPDGRWLAYESDETGEKQIYVIPFPPTGARWQISSGEDGGVYARWNPRGGELFYFADNALMSVDIQSRGDVLLPGTPKELFRPSISFSGAPYDVMPDGKTFVIRTGGGRERLNDPIQVVMNWRKDN